MKTVKGVFSILVLIFLFQTVFAEMKALTDKDMGELTGQSGIMGNLVGFGEVFASTGGSKADLDKAVSFNLAYVNQLKDLDKNIRSFQEIFERLETRPLEDGWSYFELEYHSDEPLSVPGEQLAYNDVYENSVETGLGLFGLGGFKVEGGDVHVKMSGKVKIEFRP